MRNYFVIEYDDSDQVTYDRSDSDLWPFFREVAAHFAMQDCTDEKILLVVYDGNEYRYAGWAPDMEYTFYNAADPEDTYTLGYRNMTTKKAKKAKKGVQTMKYSDHIEYLHKLHDMLPEGHAARSACTRAEYDCYCLNEVRESCVGRIQERMNSSAAADQEYCEEQRAQIGKIVQLMDDTVDDVRRLCKRDLFLKLIDKDDIYVLHCTAGSHFTCDFILYVYNPYEEAHEPVLAFDYDDIPGLQEYVQADKIGEAYALIDDYLKSKLGFVPDYEVI